MHDMDEVYDFLKKNHTYYIATIDGDKPQVRAFGTIDKFEGKLYIQTGKKKDVSKQIHANPNIAICCFDGQTWLRISATAIEDPRIEAQESMLDAHPNLKKLYQAGDGNTEVFALSDATATFSSFTAEPYTVTF